MERIVIFSAFYEPFMSGAERMVKEVAGRLQDRYYFIIVTARLSSQLSVTSNESKIKIVRVGFGLKIDKFLYPILAPFYALKYRPKIVHAVMESYAGIALSLYRFIALSLGRRPYTILTLQSGDLDLSEKQARIPKWLWRRIHSAPDLVVSIGNSMAERARRLGAKNVRIIPNGVDLEKVKEIELRFTPTPIFLVWGQSPQAPTAVGDEGRKFGFEKKPHQIICIARLSPEKGIEYLLDAMPKILQEFPDAQLVLVGDGPLKRNFEFRISNFEFSAKKAVKLLGSMFHEDVLKEISNAEALVLPSLAEGMGIVLVEAQALGVPVIGTDVGGIPDVIEHEKTGLLVPPRDKEAIAQAVMRIFKDKKLSARMAEEAKTRLGKFDWANIAERYHEIYQKVYE